MTPLIICTRLRYQLLLTPCRLNVTYRLFTFAYYGFLVSCFPLSIFKLLFVMSTVPIASNSVSFERHLSFVHIGLLQLAYWIPLFFLLPFIVKLLLATSILPTASKFLTIERHLSLVHVGLFMIPLFSPSIHSQASSRHVYLTNSSFVAFDVTFKYSLIIDSSLFVFDFV